jgi:cyclopropane fatty-acyl-phospholipid synthase-like methyltransferase
MKPVDEPKKPVKPEDEPKKPTKPEDEPKKPVEVDEKSEIVVPFVPTPDKVVDKMLEMAAVKPGDVVYDLGCGDGRIVITAVKKFKAKKGLGIDLKVERVKDSVANAKKNGVEKMVEFRQGDVLKLTDLSEADVVTMYLLPEVNLKLMPVLKKTLKPGARIVSHDFDMGDWKPEKAEKVTDDDGIEHDVFLWTIPGKKPADDQ